MFAVSVEEVAHGEVVQLQTDTTDDTRLSPTERELNLVVRLLLKVPVDVDGSVLIVKLCVGTDRLRVEVTCGGQFAGCTHKRLLREEVTGLRGQLATDNILVEAVVTVDADVVEVSLLVLDDTDFEVDGVADNVDIDWRYRREHITVVIVVVGNGIVIAVQAFLQLRLVVDVTFLHAKDEVKAMSARRVLGAIDRVTHPCDVSQEVFLSFVHLHIDVDMLIVGVPHTVLNDGGVAIAVFIVFGDELALVLLPAFGRELLRLEEGRQFAGLVGLRQGSFTRQATLDFLVAQGAVAIDDDIPDAHLLFLVDDDIEDNLVLARDVFVLDDFYLGILETLVIEVLLTPLNGLGGAVGIELHTDHQAKLGLQVFALGLLHAKVVDLRYAGQSLEAEVQVNFPPYK